MLTKLNCESLALWSGIHCPTDPTGCWFRQQPGHAVWQNHICDSCKACYARGTHVTNPQHVVRIGYMFWAPGMGQFCFSLSAVLLSHLIFLILLCVAKQYDSTVVNCFTITTKHTSTNDCIWVVNISNLQCLGVKVEVELLFLFGQSSCLPS